MREDKLLQLTMTHLTNRPDPITQRVDEQRQRTAAIVVQKNVRRYLARTIPVVFKWIRFRHLPASART